MHIRGFGFLGLVIGALGLHSVLDGETTSSPCSFADPLGLRSDSAAYGVVIPTADTAEAGSRGAYEVQLSAWESFKERVFGSSVYGQLVKLVRYSGPWKEELEDPSQEVILVPWDLSGSGSCSPTPWDQTYRWLAPDTSYLVIGIVREPKYWKRKRAVIDIPPWQFVYPGPWYDFDYLDQVFVYLPGEDTARVDSMLAKAERSPIDPVTLFSMYQAMPTYTDAERDPDGAETRIQDWETANSDLLNNFVVLKMLRFAKAQVQGIREYCAAEIENCRE